jgi:hypothetical protein
MTQMLAINTNKFFQMKRDQLVVEIIWSTETVIAEYAFVLASKVIGTPS